MFPTITSITEDELDLNALLDAITLTSTGAAAIFTGMVRGVTTRGDAHETTYLEYEAYKPMAEAKMRQVADEIRARWPVVEGIASSSASDGSTRAPQPFSSPAPPPTATPAFSTPPATALTA